MLMMILAAMTAPVFVQHEAQQKAAPPCTARRFMARNDVVSPFGWSDAAKAQAKLVSKIVEPDKAPPQYEVLPRATPPSKGPAMLQPGCRAPEKESTDYPMA